MPPPAGLGAPGVPLAPPGGAPGGPVPQPQQPFFPIPPQPIPRAFGAAVVGDRPDDDDVDVEPPDVVDLRRQFSDFVTLKADELDEARTAIEYYHGKQFTSDQLRQFRDRRQAPIVFNRIRPKVNSIVGVLKKMRGDPKVFGRSAPDEAGAELATTCVRYAMDACQWNARESQGLVMGCCHGVVVAELGLVQGDQGDPDPDVSAVDPRTFFYDPRSLESDFSDARYMGVSKFVTRDEFEEIFPPEVDPVTGAPGPSRWAEAWGSGGTDDGQTTFDYDKQYLWNQGKKLRLVEHWYRTRGEWRYCFYAGLVILDHGRSTFYDEKGRTICRFIAFAVSIDQEGIHYGFVRHLRGPQDTINFAKMKMAWIASARQLKVARQALGGDGQDIETKRTEAARADGVLIWEQDPNEVEIVTQDAEFLKQAQFYADAKAEIDNFGPSPALSGAQGVADVSGRSLAMQQQASLSELGPFLESWNGWRLRIYRAIWVAQQRNWVSQRWLRISKDPNVAQYIQINGQMIDQWGRPSLVNAIGNLDVEMIVDEGPNTVNVMADSFDLLSALAMKGMDIPAPALIELAPLPRSEKDRLLGLMNQPPDPAKVAMQQATIAATQSTAAKNTAQAQQAQADAQHKLAMSGVDPKLAAATAIHKLSLSHHETRKAHATETQAAIDAMAATGIGLPGQAAANDAMPQVEPQGDQTAPAGPALSSPLPQRPVPGGPPVRAPDGHFYVHAPHPAGIYRRIVVAP
jgi:hypothetical protein